MTDTEEERRLGDHRGLRVQVRARMSFMTDGVELYGRALDPQDRHASWQLREVVAVRRDVGDAGYPYPPVMQLSAEAAKELMDSLWSAGVRPSDEGTPGQLGAMREHIADLRIIAFRSLHIGEEK